VIEESPLRRRDDLTFKANLRDSRHGWIRLTPAYSVHLVAEILDAERPEGGLVLDPFCGTGTTALVCAERGIAAETTDINPFLIWLAQAKARAYAAAELTALGRVADRIRAAIRAPSSGAVWAPPLFRIERWWDEATLAALGRAMAEIRGAAGEEAPAVLDLARVAFCRTLIERAQVSFGHQSMSFAKAGAEEGEPGRGAEARSRDAAEAVAQSFERAAESVARGAASAIPTSPRVLHCDARDLRARLEPERYRCVITSPPYPNRMSYIRELRPYMYWLGYLADGRAAGELDWQAIGGTWGVATSNVARWAPERPAPIPFEGFEALLERIAVQSEVLSRYVHKYFHDMARHAASLFAVMRPGGAVHYIVGNSKFYDVLVPAERIFAELFAAAGFASPEVRAIRKRSSKRELYEFVVSARKP